MLVIVIINLNINVKRKSKINFIQFVLSAVNRYMNVQQICILRCLPPRLENRNSEKNFEREV